MIASQCGWPVHQVRRGQGGEAESLGTINEKLQNTFNIKVRMYLFLTVKPC